MAKQKIAVIHSGTFHGGAENSLMDMLNGLSCYFHCFLIIHPGTELFRKINQSGLPIEVRTFELPEITKKNSGNRLLPTLVHTWRSSRQITKFCQSHEIKTVLCNTSKSLIYTSLLKCSGCRIITFCRDNPIYSLARFGTRMFSHKIVTVSDHIREQLGRTRKTVTIYNAVRKPPSTGKDIRKIYGIGTSEYCITMVAHWVEWKNQGTFIQIAHKILEQRNDVRFMLIGKVRNEAFYRKIRETVRPNNDHFIFVTDCDYTQIGDFYENTDVLLHTAIREPFGRVIAEAMLYEKPVVAFRSGGPAEIIRHGETGILTDPENPEIAATEMIKLLDSPARRRSFGLAGRAYAESNFHVSQFMKKLIVHLPHG